MAIRGRREFLRSVTESCECINPTAVAVDTIVNSRAAALAGGIFTGCPVVSVSCRGLAVSKEPIRGFSMSSGVLPSSLC